MRSVTFEHSIIPLNRVSTFSKNHCFFATKVFANLPENSLIRKIWLIIMVFGMLNCAIFRWLLTINLPTLVFGKLSGLIAHRTFTHMRFSFGFSIVTLSLHWPASIGLIISLSSNSSNFLFIFVKMRFRTLLYGFANGTIVLFIGIETCISLFMSNCLTGKRIYI